MPSAEHMPHLCCTGRGPGRALAVEGRRRVPRRIAVLGDDGRCSGSDASSVSDVMATGASAVRWRCVAAPSRADSGSQPCPALPCPAPPARYAPRTSADGVRRSLRYVHFMIAQPCH